MFNDSATGGYLTPIGPPPIDDVSLMDFLHTVIEGVTQLPKDLIRQMWQKNPAPVPSNGVDWVSYGITEKRQDPYPYQDLNENDIYEFRVQEDIDVMFIFYGVNCMSNASLLRDGMYIVQNSESMNSLNLAFKSFGNMPHVPEIPTLNYFDRCDLTMTLRRQVKREYRVLNLLKAMGTITANTSTNVYADDFETP